MKNRLHVSSYLANSNASAPNPLPQRGNPRRRGASRCRRTVQERTFIETHQHPYCVQAPVRVRLLLLLLICVLFGLLPFWRHRSAGDCRGTASLQRSLDQYWSPWSVTLSAKPAISHCRISWLLQRFPHAQSLHLVCQIFKRKRALLEKTGLSDTAT